MGVGEVDRRVVTLITELKSANFFFLFFSKGSDTSIKSAFFQVEARDGSASAALAVSCRR